MNRTFKKILKLFLIGIISLSIVPFNVVLAQSSVNSGMLNIEGYEKTKGYDYIYFGQKAGNAIKWKVLSTSGNAVNEGNTLTNENGEVVDNSNAYFLLSDGYMVERTLCPEGTTGRKIQYPISLVKAWCDMLAENGSADEYSSKVGNDTVLWETGIAFSDQELKSVLKVNKDEPGGLELEEVVATLNVSSELKDDKFFLPSISEMLNSEYGFSDSLSAKDDNRISQEDIREGQQVGAQSYYLRTIASSGKSTRGASFVQNDGTLGYQTVASYASSTTRRIHLATNLSKDAILFTTAAGSEKAVLSKAENNTTHEWKLTLKDDKDFSDGASLDAAISAPGREVAITHKSLVSVSEDYNHVTAAIYDKDKNLLYYGYVNDDKAATESKLTVPEDIEDGTYILKVFGEQWNGAKNTDYASGTPFETELTIDSAAVAADEVKETISALPSVDKITLSDKKAVESARKAYDALTNKDNVDAETLKKLTDAENKIAELTKAEEDKKTNATTATQSTTQTTQTTQTTEASSVTSSVKAGKVVTVGNMKYKVTSIKAKSRSVTVTGMKNKKKTSVKIPATIKINKTTYKVTAIGNNAFKANKKLKTVTIGANVKTIGKNAFASCKNVKKIIVKSSVLKKVGAKSLNGIHKKAVIKVPAKKLKAYKKLFNKKGQAKTVKISK